MNETVKIFFGLIGGLALFLYGMNSMSDALQKTAGERMKKILSFLTKNPIMGALASALITAVLQSSSATTVMAIGFVSAGLMSLPQAISLKRLSVARIKTSSLSKFHDNKIVAAMYLISQDKKRLVCFAEGAANDEEVSGTYLPAFDGLHAAFNRLRHRREQAP